MLEKPAEAFQAQRQYDNAKKLLDAVVAIRAEVAGVQSLEYGVGLMKLADLEKQRNRPKDAAEFYAKAAQVLGDRPTAARALIYLAVMNMSNKNYRQATDYFQKAQNLDAAEAGPARMWMARSDIFSFGALLYEMVTGQRAFQGVSKLSTLSAILREEPKPASQVVEGLPRELERVIARCLRKSPDRRFQAMPDLKVALEELKEESDSGTLMRPAPVTVRRGNRRLVWAAVLLTILTLGAGTLWFVRSTAKAPEAILHAVPLTTYPGFQGEPTFSPDGNQVAFAWDGEKQDNGDIYVKLIGTSGQPLRVTTDKAVDYSPAWSPDGRYIAFLRELPGEKAAVLLIPALGGPEHKVAQILTTGFLPGPFLAWSPDGNWLVISGKDSPTERAALFLLSIDTGEKRRLTSPPEHLTGDSCPALSPDGRTLAFTRSTDAGVDDLYLMALSAELQPQGEVRRLTLGNRGFGKPAWTPDGREIVFAGTSGELWRIAPSGSAEPQRLASLGEGVAEPAISPRGRRLAYKHSFFHSNIWRIAAPTGHGPGSLKSPKPAGTATPFISSTRIDNSPQFSPDGKRIAFMSRRSGNFEIWISNADGSNALQLTNFGGPGVTTPRWSPDGGRIAFDSNATWRI